MCRTAILCTHTVDHKAISWHWSMILIRSNALHMYRPFLHHTIPLISLTNMSRELRKQPKSEIANRWYICKFKDLNLAKLRDFSHKWHMAICKFKKVATNYREEIAHILSILHYTMNSNYTCTCTHVPNGLKSSLRFSFLNQRGILPMKRRESGRL